MRPSRFARVAAIALFCAAPFLYAQGRRGGGGGGAPPEKPEEGIPVTDPLVIAKCGTCHTRDDKGNLSRISWERAAPEGWEEAIKRMVRLNGLEISPADARSVLKYLSTYHGLAPEEAKSVMYIAEHPANACYYLGSVLVFRAIFAAIADQAIDTSALNEGARVAEGSKIALNNINEANLHVHNVLYGLISWLLEKETGKTFEEMEVLRIPVVGAPKPSRIALPMFIDIGS